MVADDYDFFCAVNRHEQFARQSFACLVRDDKIKAQLVQAEIFFLQPDARRTRHGKIFQQVFADLPLSFGVGQHVAPNCPITLQVGAARFCQCRPIFGNAIFQRQLLKLVGNFVVVAATNNRRTFNAHCRQASQDVVDSDVCLRHHQNFRRGRKFELLPNDFLDDGRFARARRSLNHEKIFCGNGSHDGRQLIFVAQE